MDPQVFWGPNCCLSLLHIHSEVHKSVHGDFGLVLILYPKERKQSSTSFHSKTWWRFSVSKICRCFPMNDLIVGLAGLLFAWRLIFWIYLPLHSIFISLLINSDILAHYTPLILFISNCFNWTLDWNGKFRNAYSWLPVIMSNSWGVTLHFSIWRNVQFLSYCEKDIIYLWLKTQTKCLIIGGNYEFLSECEKASCVQFVVMDTSDTMAQLEPRFSSVF